ncbi:MAG: hypothetical protein ABJC89_03015 [Acidobacteriota bacterium]
MKSPELPTRRYPLCADMPIPVEPMDPLPVAPVAPLPAAPVPVAVPVAPLPVAVLPVAPLPVDPLPIAEPDPEPLVETLVRMNSPPEREGDEEPDVLVAPEVDALPDCRHPVMVTGAPLAELPLVDPV